MNSLSTAKTILQQLGGGKFTAMTGAKKFLGDDRSLTFSLPSNFAKDKINKVRVTLNWEDTYDIEFFYIRGCKVVEVAQASGVYCDQLQEVFTDHTGLDTHL